MSEYTPTTEEVIRKFATGATWQRQSYAAAELEVRRWLAAHDAELRAPLEAALDRASQRVIDLRVGAEEPEWEYGIALFGEMDDVQPWPTEERALRELQDAEDILIRRRKAGEWVPVKQEGAETGGMAR